MEQNNVQNWSAIEVGEKLFQWRDYTPIPLILFLVFVASPTVLSSTLGTLIIVAGEVFRLLSVSYIGSVSRTRSDSTGPRIVTTGPYGMVRNPLYVGNFFIVLGISTFGGRAWFAVIAMLAFAFQYYCIVAYEEKHLEEKFGDEYRAYREVVPAWFPRTLPRNINWANPAPLAQALISEKWTMTTVVAVVILLILRSKS